MTWCYLSTVQSAADGSTCSTSGCESRFRAASVYWHRASSVRLMTRTDAWGFHISQWVWDSNQIWCMLLTHRFISWTTQLNVGIASCRPSSQGREDASLFNHLLKSEWSFSQTLTKNLTHTMGQSPSWWADMRSVSQEILAF